MKPEWAKGLELVRSIDVLSSLINLSRRNRISCPYSFAAAGTVKGLWRAGEVELDKYLRSGTSHDL